MKEKDYLVTFEVGSGAQWDSLNGLKTGRIEVISEKGILVRLGNGKCIIAHETSLKKV